MKIKDSEPITNKIGETQQEKMTQKLYDALNVDTHHFLTKGLSEGNSTNEQRMFRVKTLLKKWVDECKINNKDFELDTTKNKEL